MLRYLNVDHFLQRIEETKIIREKLRKLKESESDPEAVAAKPLFRSAIEELLDAGVDDRQIVDEFNTMMFGVLLYCNYVKILIRDTHFGIRNVFFALGTRNWRQCDSLFLLLHGTESRNSGSGKKGSG